jgi:hypothetical protein
MKSIEKIILLVGGILILLGIYFLIWEWNSFGYVAYGILFVLVGSDRITAAVFIKKRNSKLVYALFLINSIAAVLWALIIIAMSHPFTPDGIRTPWPLMIILLIAAVMILIECCKKDLKKIEDKNEIMKGMHNG